MSWTDKQTVLSNETDHCRETYYNIAINGHSTSRSFYINSAEQDMPLQINLVSGQVCQSQATNTQDVGRGRKTNLQNDLWPTFPPACPKVSAD